MLRRLLLPFVGNKRFYPLFSRLYSLSLAGMNVGRGGDVWTSGEHNVLDYVRKHHGKKGHPVIFDVGANKGQYTKSLLKFFHGHDVEIHCFEPGYETFRILTQEIGGHGNITLNNFGLSSTKTQSTLYYDNAGSGLASLYKRQLDYFNIEFDKSENVMLDTLDNYVSAKTIGAIDLLKIDVEGNELNVLEGAEGSLSAGKIRAIQIEFGGCNIDSRTFIRDFWNLLHKDFVMYRIMKNGFVEIPKYYETIEIFTCTNFFFAKR